MKYFSLVGLTFVSNLVFAVSMELIPTPAGENSSLSRLYTNDGITLLSWVEQGRSKASLMYSHFTSEDGWSNSKTVAFGDNWFNNWADYPSMITNNGSLTAHWLQMTNEGKYDYAIKVAGSKDMGKTWSQPITPHSDGVDAEHGFVSMLPLENDTTFITWLDGRNTKIGMNDNKEHSHHGKGGAMTLRAATLKDGKLLDEWLIDERVCDCCSTTVTRTDGTIVVAYRDRSTDDIRDINVVRLVNGQWKPSSSVPVDNWNITGCPVNGPALDSKGDIVGLSWYTMVDDKSTVKLAVSQDKGDNFSKEIIVSQNTIGRVDTVIFKSSIIVSYLEAKGNKVELKVDRFNYQGQRIDSVTVTELSPRRSTGFPSLTNNNGQILISWNDDRVKTAKVNFK